MPEPGAFEEFEIPTLGSKPTKEQPYVFDINDAQPIIKVDLGNDAVRGVVDSYYFNEDGKKVETVTTFAGHFGQVELVDGKFERTMSGDFRTGEIVRVKRSSGELEDGWTVTGSTNEEGNHRTIVHKDGLVKQVFTTALRELNRPVAAVENEGNFETEREKAEDDLGEIAVEEVVLPVFGVSEAAQRIVNDAQLSELPEPSVDQKPEQPPETQEQMYARFIKERQADLQQYYAELRRAKPNSDEAHDFETKIKYAKEDIHHYMKLRRS